MAMEIAPGKTRIGWIGTGVMGSSMCGHLIDKGFSATVYSRTKAKAEALIAKGAAWAETPRAVAEQSDVIFSIVGFPSDVREVMLGEQGALAGCKSGNVLVDMTTSQPSLAAARRNAGVDLPPTQIGTGFLPPNTMSNWTFTAQRCFLQLTVCIAAFFQRPPRTVRLY